MKTQSEPRPAKLDELEALRGLLALWVLVAHVTARVISDATIAKLHFQAILEPLTAVSVFMILSGFVITLLLVREKPSYGSFIVRRVFRLVPLYLCALAISVLLARVELRTLQDLFMRNAHIYDAIKVHREALGNFWSHLWAHVFLLQGLIPDTVLPDSNYTFLSQGWSVSLEMQFYLLAPLLVFLVVRRRAVLLALLLAGLAALAVLQLPSVGFLPNQMNWFALGIGSFGLYTSRAHWILRVPARWHDAALLLLCALLYRILHNPLPVIIWLVVLDLLLTAKTGMHTPLTGLLLRFFHQPLLLWLGRISYSVYLLHIPVLYLVFGAVTQLNGHIGGWKFLALALPGTLLATIALSAVTYRFIERPGMRWAAAWPNRRRRSNLFPLLRPPDTAILQSRHESAGFDGKRLCIGPGHTG